MCIFLTCSRMETLQLTLYPSLKGRELNLALVPTELNWPAASSEQTVGLRPLIK